MFLHPLDHQYRFNVGYFCILANIYHPINILSFFRSLVWHTHTQKRLILSKWLPSSRFFRQKQFLCKQQEQLLSFLWFYLDCVQSNNKRFRFYFFRSFIFIPDTPKSARCCSISNKMPLFKRMMECKCVRCVNDVRTSHTRTHTQAHVNGKLEEKFYASTEQHKPEKNKENRFASGERGRKNYVIFLSSVGLAMEYYLSFLYVFPKECECFCCADIFALDRIHAASATVQKKSHSNENSIDHKRKRWNRLEISFLILEKLPSHKLVCAEVEEEE